MNDGSSPGRTITYFFIHLFAFAFDELTFGFDTFKCNNKCQHEMTDCAFVVTVDKYYFAL